MNLRPSTAQRNHANRCTINAAVIDHLNNVLEELGDAAVSILQTNGGICGDLSGLLLMSILTTSAYI